MKKEYSVSEAARAARMTGETLRHYDRIGLVCSSRRDPDTQYRYYTEGDIVRLCTVHALQQMDLPLAKIKEVLAYDDPAQIAAFFTQAERMADEKIAALESSRERIRRARTEYEGKQAGGKDAQGAFVRSLPSRVILLSDSPGGPAVDTLWNYLSRFYAQLPQPVRDRFTFEDQAGVYADGEVERLFAVCIRHTRADGLKTLPAGDYLCAGCAEADRVETVRALVHAACERTGRNPPFSLALVRVTGILQWRYEVQVYLEKGTKHEKSPMAL